MEGTVVRPLVLAWVPPAVALVVFAQVCLLGLKPSLAESRRLAQAEELLQARHSAALERRQELDRVLRAQSDPIYLERERKLLRTPGNPLRD
jgi:hypothetical protein